MEYFDITLTLIDASLKNMYSTELKIISLKKAIKKNLAEEAQIALKGSKSRNRSINLCKLQIKIYESQIKNMKPPTLVRTAVNKVKIKSNAFKLANIISMKQNVNLELALIKAKVLLSIKGLNFHHAKHMMKKLTHSEENRKRKLLENIQEQRDTISKLMKKRVDSNDYKNYMSLSKKWHHVHEKLLKRREECIAKFKVKSIEDTCPICLETDDNLIKTKCGHYYHGECISEMIGTAVTSRRFGSLKITCPMCREALLKITD
jgi:hypothetical protein